MDANVEALNKEVQEAMRGFFESHPEIAAEMLIDRITPFELLEMYKHTFIKETPKGL